MMSQDLLRQEDSITIDTICSELIELLTCYVTEVPMGEIMPSSLLAEELCLNSFDTVSLVGDIEEQYGIDISLNEVRKMKTVKDVAVYICKCKKNLGK